jgi:hypothetical protein
LVLLNTPRGDNDGQDFVAMLLVIACLVSRTTGSDDTVVLFDDQYEIMHNGTRINYVPLLTKKTYVPVGPRPSSMRSAGQSMK